MFLKSILSSVILLSAVSSSFAEDQTFNLTEVCKKECPKATNNDEAHKCAEKIGRLNKAFRKSKCWEVNEKYEASLEKPK